MREEREAIADNGNYRNIVKEFMIDRTRRSGSFEMGQPHYHPYYELFFLISGRCRIFINHTIYYLSPGDMVLLLPYQLHKTIYDKGQTSERFTINFIPEYIEYFSSQCSPDGFRAVFSRKKLSLPPEAQEFVEELLSRMLKETVISDCYSEIQMKSLLFSLLSFLGRCKDLEQPAQTLDKGDALIQEAAQYIHAHHRENLTLETMAAYSHMSPAWFSKKFHQTAGLGFKEYLTHVRLEDAQELLLTTSLTVTEIALTCGFSNGNYFGDAFKKMVGVSPREYRFGGHSTIGGQRNNFQKI